ncbi:MAG: GatB/YqeY domain-containing protein [Thermotogaceae bacterium]|nr:GatB/YqeY domain-containing protein [Thermotogaceae bacterium]
MNLKDRIREDLKSAMKGRDKVAVRTLRMVIAAIKNFEVEKMKEAADEDVIAVLQKEAKKRKEAIEQYSAAGREDLASSEKAELEIIKRYLPEQMSEEDVKELAKEIIDQVGAKTAKDFGRVMKEIMPRVKGKADGKLVNKIVRELLQG